MTLKEIRAEIRKIDPAVKPQSDEFRVYTLLLAALEVGAYPAAVAKFTGIDKIFVLRVGRRLRESGIWKNGKTHADWWNKKSGGIALAADCAVGLGFIRRVEADKSRRGQHEDRQSR